MQSIFMLIDGIVHEWITSKDDVISIIWVLSGIIKWLSVSIRLKLKFDLFIKYELIFLLKFKYS